MTSTQPHDVVPPYEGPPVYSEGHPLKEEVHTISAPSENRSRRKRSTAATLISMIYVIPYLGILIASMVALGFMASIHNSVKNNFGGGKCVLYSTLDDNKDVKFNTGQSCKFIIYGEAALGILAVLLIILSVVKAVFGKW